jgi:general stress protein 26
MDDVKRLMNEIGWGDLATSDGKTVGVRPMGGWAWIGKELWSATAASSDKVAQLRKVPHAEYCFSKEDGTHVRLAGACTISTDSKDKRRLYDAVPVLKDHIKDPASPEYVVIRMRPDRVRVMVPPDLGYTEVKPA